MRILNLGAGVQSTAIFLMIMDGDLPPVDFAIFADTGDEPKSVYQHLEKLKQMNAMEIVTVTQGNLGQDLIDGVNSTGQRFVSIPSYLSHGNSGEKTGLGRRQCTAEYKLKPIIWLLFLLSNILKQTELCLKLKVAALKITQVGNLVCILIYFLVRLAHAQFHV